MLMICWLLIIPLTTAQIEREETKAHAEQRLMNYLEKTLTKYSPPDDSNQKLSIRADVYQVVDVMEKEGIWSARILFQVGYKANLTWKPESFKGISEVLVPPGKFWTPPIGIEEATEPKYDLVMGSQLIKSSGDIFASYQKVLAKMLCSFDVTKFPFDNQTCKVTFAQRAETSSDILSVKGRNTDFDSVVSLSSEQWEIHTYTTREKKTIVITACLTRRPLHYLLVLVLPIVSIYILSGLSFILPPDATEKISFSVTILLAEVVAFSSLSEILPANSANIPVFLYFLTVVMWHTGFLCLVAVIVVNLSHNGWRMWMGRRLLYLISTKWLYLIGLTPLSNQSRYRHFTSFRSPKLSVLDRLGLHTLGIALEANTQSDDHALEQEDISKREAEMELEKEKNEVRWRFLAIVVDRICLFIHIFAMTFNLTFFVCRMFLY